MVWSGSCKNDRRRLKWCLNIYWYNFCKYSTKVKIEICNLIFGQCILKVLPKNRLTNTLQQAETPIDNERLIKSTFFFSWTFCSEGLTEADGIVIRNMIFSDYPHIFWTSCAHQVSLQTNTGWKNVISFENKGLGAGEKEIPLTPISSKILELSWIVELYRSS